MLRGIRSVSATYEKPPLEGEKRRRKAERKKKVRGLEREPSQEKRREIKRGEEIEICYLSCK